MFKDFIATTEKNSRFNLWSWQITLYMVNSRQLRVVKHEVTLYLTSIKINLLEMSIVCHDSSCQKSTELNFCTKTFFVLVNFCTDRDFLTECHFCLALLLYRCYLDQLAIASFLPRRPLSFTSNLYLVLELSVKV